MRRNFTLNNPVAMPVEQVVAVRALSIVLMLVVLNFAYNQGMAVAGYGFPFTSFLVTPTDQFADYFKFILSLPGGKQIIPSNLLGLHDQIHMYQINNPYFGIDGFASHSLTHLHAAPLTMLFCLVSVRIMRVADPTILFLLTSLVLLGWWCWIGMRFAVRGGEGLCWVTLGLISYPVVLMVTRGNVYAAAAAFFIVQALLLSYQDKSPVLSATLLALAVCIRPNAIIFAAPVIAMVSRDRIKQMISLGTTLTLVSTASLIASHALYPDYTLENFLAGLHSYYDHYVVQDMGMAYGSSLYGGLRLLFGYISGLDRVAAVPSLLIVVLGAYCWYRYELRRSSLVFLTCAAYCLGSTVLADYHIFVFIAVPMMVAHEARTEIVRARDWIAVITSCLILAPKNYLFSGDASWQVVINPIIILIAAATVIALQLRSKTGGRKEEQLVSVAY
ncbi:MAG: hypothetical protein JWO15_2651 [Sphingomonadales bacterium]|nr:hypothetical protein [Sphingomonadales bacterium]